MIIVHGTFPVKPELRDAALKMMRRMATASKAESGCITYEFYVGLTDPNTLLLFQEWESVDALQGHFETGHMESFLRKLPDVLNGEVSTRRYEVRVSNDLLEEHQEFETEPTSQFEYHEKIVH
jgi:quinol monooxygenase YgiN